MSEAERAEDLVAAYLDRREAGELLDFETYLRAEAAEEVRPAARAIYASVREVLGTLAPVPLEDEREWRYRTREPLGRGGNAEVFAVFDLHMERELAMKLVRQDGTSDGLERRRKARFVAEAKLAGRLAHPAILAVHDLGRTPEGQEYFTMPKLEGQTLYELIQGLHGDDAPSLEPDTFGLPRLLDVLLRVAEAVAFAHSRGVVHRDIKPANIMVGRFGETYLLDWGLATEVAELSRAAEPEGDGEGLPASGDAAFTRDGDVVGTPAYMAPEQALGGARDVDRRADVYSLGACLHEILVGEPPYGAQLGALETLQKLREGPPPDLSVAHPGTLAELAAVVRRALARNPDQRYASAEEFAADLRAFVEGRVVRAYESGGLAELRKWVRRNRGFAGALAATVLALVGGVIFALLVRSGERARSLRFLDLQLVQESRSAMEVLWEPDAGRGGRLEDWLLDARELAERLDLHRDELAELDERAQAAREQAAAWGGWTFADRDLRWRHENLSELVRELERFAGPGGSLDVVQRGLDRLEVEWPGSLFPADWDAARAAIQGAGVYGDLQVEPIPGLAPLGLNPTTGLFEFALVGSGDPPAPGATPADGDAVVFVLIPGGVTVVGVAPDDGGARTGFELAGVEVRLDPFLIGKQELSRGQWDRLVHAAEPSRSPGYPRREVTVNEAVAVLRRWDLSLPTEAQWERTAELSLEGVDPQLLDDADWARAQLGPLRTAAAAPPDRLGLHNLLGNLAEFCADPIVASPRFIDGTGALDFAPEEALAGQGLLKGGHYLITGLGNPAGLPGFVRPEFRLTARLDEESERHGVRVCRSLRPRP